LVEMISSLAPFGKDNPSTLFSIENVNLAAQKLLGAEGKHLKLILQEKDPKKPVEALIWNVLNKGIGNQGKLDPTLKYHLVVAPELNTFNNTTKIQLIVQDIQPAGTSRVQETSLQNSHKLTPSIQSEPSDSRVFTSNDTPNMTSPSSINWIDHRSRESIESFVGQLMLPLQDGRKILLFHEGRKPQIPFLQEEIIAQRNTITASEDLILWDIPADLEIFHHVIQSAQPKVIHLIGGKYQTVPVFPQVRDYLKIIYQTLMKQSAQGPSTTSDFLQIQFEEIASQLACTPSVIYQGLILLVKVGLVQIEEILQTEGYGAKASSAKPSSAVLSFPPSQAQTNPLGDPALEKSLEWVTMHQALNEMGKFRSWVIKSPIEKIKNLVMTESNPVDPVLPHFF
ncbi:MAG: hypothetical protein K2X66_01800, partial [Cyanobacteria bacterium]|nr:hypothetical protein [Cyanobacteriota bacterium]